MHLELLSRLFLKLIHLLHTPTQFSKCCGLLSPVDYNCGAHLTVEIIYTATWVLQSDPRLMDASNELDFIWTRHVWHSRVLKFSEARRHFVLWRAALPSFISQRFVPQTSSWVNEIVPKIPRAHRRQTFPRGDFSFSSFHRKTRLEGSAPLNFGIFLWFMEEVVKPQKEFKSR